MVQNTLRKHCRLHYKCKVVTFLTTYKCVLSNRNTKRFGQLKMCSALAVRPPDIDVNTRNKWSPWLTQVQLMWTTMTPKQIYTIMKCPIWEKGDTSKLSSEVDPGMEKDIIIYYGGNNKSSLPFKTELHSVAFSNTAYDIMTDDWTFSPALHSLNID